MTVPITYRGKDGRQYVAVVAVGAGLGGPPPRGPDGRPANNESVYALRCRADPNPGDTACHVFPP